MRKRPRPMDKEEFYKRWDALSEYKKYETIEDLPLEKDFKVKYKRRIHTFSMCLQEDIK